MIQILTVSVCVFIFHFLLRQNSNHQELARLHMMEQLNKIQLTMTTALSTWICTSADGVDCAAITTGLVHASQDIRDHRVQMYCYYLFEVTQLFPFSFNIYILI